MSVKRSILIDEQTKVTVKNKVTKKITHVSDKVVPLNTTHKEPSKLS